MNFKIFAFEIKIIEKSQVENYSIYHQETLILHQQKSTSKNQT